MTGARGMIAPQNGQPHMDGTTTVSFNKHFDRPGMIQATISGELGAHLTEAAQIVGELERQRAAAIAYLLSEHAATDAGAEVKAVVVGALAALGYL